MQTTCPECRTTFRVSQDHLGSRRGLVRCGHCNAVFNAYDTLLPELESPPDESAPEQDRAEPALSDAIRPVWAPSDQPASGKPSAAAVAAPVEREAGRPESFEVPPRVAARVESKPVAAKPKQDVAASPIASSAESALPAPAATVPDILLEPMWPKVTRPARSGQFWLYRTLALLLAGLLLVQGAYFLRAELAAVAPVTRPALEWLCRPLHCVVPLPRQLTQAAIAASSLEHDPENKSRVRLTFLLTNRSGQTQAWPQIMLTLSDVREAPVARRVFRPKAYLPKDVDIAAGMAAEAEREIRLDLDIGNLVASGYALSLSYP